jgi:methylenetetrahydrofolate--tRNA-(uracil-5-)-methyltransferase
LTHAQRAELPSFDLGIELGVKAGSSPYFEACLPVEVLAARGLTSLAFGPMSPMGIRNTHTNLYPYAVVQLRQDNIAGTFYNMVGFQTNLTIAEQARIFRLIPGLGKSEFIRYGHMHRNTYINSPEVLLPSLQFQHRADLFFAGQVTGAEGYLGNIATGVLAGINATRIIQGKEPLTFPPTTMIGSLIHYITHASLKDFQPMKANLGLLPPLINHISDKQKRNKSLLQRTRQDFETFRTSHPD